MRRKTRHKKHILMQNCNERKNPLKTKIDIKNCQSVSYWTKGEKWQQFSLKKQLRGLCLPLSLGCWRLGHKSRSKISTGGGSRHLPLALGPFLTTTEIVVILRVLGTLMSIPLWLVIGPRGLLFGDVIGHVTLAQKASYGTKG